MARPSKLTPERREKIASLIQAGNYASQAAQAVGISPRSYFRWMEEGEKVSEKCEAWQEAVENWNELSDQERSKHPELEPNPEDEPTEQEAAYFQFWREIKKAEAEAEAAAVLHIKKAASEGTWQAAAWFLERKHKQRWGKQDRVEHAGVVSHDHAHQLLPTAPEAIEEARERLRAARALPSGAEAPETDKSNQEKTPDPAPEQKKGKEEPKEEVIEAEVVED